MYQSPTKAYPRTTPIGFSSGVANKRAPGVHARWIIAAALIAACSSGGSAGVPTAPTGGGNPSTPPSSSYSGIYVLTGDFDNLPGRALSGSAVLAQTGQSVNGTVTMTEDATYYALTGANLSVQNGTVLPDGSLIFELGWSNYRWRFRGLLVGGNIGGADTIYFSSTTEVFYTGHWSGTRASQ
jgi:hypothetical protein